MLRVEHIGIAIKDIAISIPLFEKLLNCACYKTETVESEKVKTAFFKNGDTKIELLESIDENGVIAGFIAKKGEGIHHIAFEVIDILDEMQRLEREGFSLLSSTPRRGADNKLVCFYILKARTAFLWSYARKLDEWWGIGYRQSGIGYRVSGIGYRVSGIGIGIDCTS